MTTTTITEELVSTFSLSDLMTAVARADKAWSHLAGNPRTATDLIQAQADVWGWHDAKLEAAHALVAGARMDAAAVREVLA